MVPEYVLGDTLWADTVDTLDTVECAVPVGLRYVWTLRCIGVLRHCAGTVTLRGQVIAISTGSEIFPHV